jgi:hypothetical protein
MDMAGCSPVVRRQHHGSTSFMIMGVAAGRSREIGTTGPDKSAEFRRIDGN